MVLVSHRHQFIFMKTRKTASTSLEMYFQPFAQDESSDPVSENASEAVSAFGIVGARTSFAKDALVWKNHMSADDIRHNIGREKFNDYAKIATVRNPYSRMISYFFGVNKRLSVSISNQNLFKEFVMFGNWQNDQDVTHFTKDTGRAQYCVDHVIRFENINYDLAKVCDTLDLPFEPEKLANTKSRTQNMIGQLAQWYDKEMSDRIQQKFQWVFSRFDYQLQ